MNHEDYVTYEQAVKLKELGFDWETHAFYSEVGELYSSNFPENWSGELWESISAPTLAQAAKWLREVKKSHVIVNISKWLTTTPYRLDIYQEFGEDIIPMCTQNDFQTYEQALSAGIDKALELLKSL